MSDSWFTTDELDQMVRPTMDRAVDAIRDGDVESAIALCEGMKNEWRFLHDLMVDLIGGLISFVHSEIGEDAVPKAWAASMERGWQRDTEKILETDRKRIVEGLAASWRAHSTSGVGANAGAFTIEEDAEKFTFRMNPCGSGQRLWRNGAYEGPNALALISKPHDWSYERQDFPIYCTHCTFMNELLPIKWYGMPLYPSEPPKDFDHDPCTWYWYKNPEDIPDLYWERYNETRPSTHASEDL